MKLLRRFGEFLNKYVAETTAIIVGLLLILLLFEFYFVFSGTKFLELLPTVIALISVVLLFCALLQSINANKVNRQKVTYDYYLEKVIQCKSEGKNIHQISNVADLVELQPLTETNYNLFEGSILIQNALGFNLFDNPKNESLLDELHSYIFHYINFYAYLNYFLIKLLDENLSRESESVLIKHFSDCFFDFSVVGNNMNDFNLDNVEIRNSSSLALKYSYISQIQDIHRSVQPILKY